MLLAWSFVFLKCFQSTTDEGPPFCSEPHLHVHASTLHNRFPKFFYLDSRILLLEKRKLQHTAECLFQNVLISIVFIRNSWNWMVSLSSLFSCQILPISHFTHSHWSFPSSLEEQLVFLYTSYSSQSSSCSLPLLCCK